ncbi:MULTISPECIES: septum formation family protein [unclassified Corynebacterium]|uniref:septum formation family protein n=1 Tax=unclassified Corynebacterium TaxID=2624378 RepID=UPI0029C9E274|nr:MULTISPECIES: septum formation family protein [unclassified Corynebacterium]WPF66048.1 septum formation family protein [Corynebacterium sp. 22KM0430]WPF68541.1 septum formation family protein [Corynebacterium sp. 21KM1197]
MSLPKTWRTALSVRTALIGALTSAVGLVSFNLVAGQEDAPLQASPSATSSSHAEDGTSTEHPEGAAKKKEAQPFTAAQPGACLTWDVAEDGTVSNFAEAPCEGDHRFEVSARQDLGAYPSSEFGDKAAPPDVTRQAQLRSELCHNPTLRYLDGRFDPSGRYSIASILPPAEAWAGGDRTMLCGLQSTNPAGTPEITHGTVGSQDQARVTQPGQCVSVNAANSLGVVDCGEDHQLETTSVVNLLETFPEGIPSVEDQDKHLQEVCTKAAEDYLGGPENLEKTTLQIYWGSIPSESWIGGSHSVNCSLISAHGESGFNSLRGSATGEFTINGAPPAPEEITPAPAPAADAGAGTAPGVTPGDAGAGAAPVAGQGVPTS